MTGAAGKGDTALPDAFITVRDDGSLAAEGPVTVETLPDGRQRAEHISGTTAETLPGGDVRFTLADGGEFTLTRRGWQLRAVIEDGRPVLRPVWVEGPPRDPPT